MKTYKGVIFINRLVIDKLFYINLFESLDIRCLKINNNYVNNKGGYNSYDEDVNIADNEILKLVRNF